MQEQTARPLYPFRPLFAGDIGDPNSKLCELVASDKIFDPAYDEELARQKSAIPDAELRKNARQLLLDLQDHWNSGVYIVQGLGELLEEQQRRRVLGKAYEDWSLLAEWLAGCLRPEDEYAAYCPNADDVRALIQDIAHCYKDGMSRPGFLDIAR